MSHLNSIGPAANVAVLGASGGIGSEFVRQLADDEGVARVYALSRTSTEERPGVISMQVDFADEPSLERAAQIIFDDAPLDLVIVASGVLHSPEFQPEKRLQDAQEAAMLEVFRINTVGPALAAKHFLPALRKNHKSVFAALSARVGSISDNRLGGWLSYRSSKAALNMVLKTAAIEHKRRFPESIVIGLHPGTVDTALSAPFQQRVPDGKLFTPEYSVQRLLEVIDNVGQADTGRCFAWDGQRIEF